MCSTFGPTLELIFEIIRCRIFTIWCLWKRKFLLWEAGLESLRMSSAWKIVMLVLVNYSAPSAETQWCDKDQLGSREINALFFLFILLKRSFLSRKRQNWKLYPSCSVPCFESDAKVVIQSLNTHNSFSLHWSIVS